MTLAIQRPFFSKTPGRLLLFFIYFTSINLLAGFVAEWLEFPSLWGNKQVFDEYAIPILMTWGTAHWPSLLLAGVPLLLLPGWSAMWVRRFRAICVVLFFLLMYGVREKIPFALFPAVDVLVAFSLSLVVVPFTFKENPLLSIFVLVLTVTGSISAGYLLYEQWQHRVPVIKHADLMQGLFRLESISVNHGYREILFTVTLTRFVEQPEACATATAMGKDLFNTYPYDNQYRKIVKIGFKPASAQADTTAYPLGEVAESRDKGNGELPVECYIRYKDS